MGNINDKQLQELEQSVQAKWTEAFVAEPQTQLNSLATRYTSTTASNNYAFLEALGSWSEWHGARQFKDIASDDYKVINRTYESSIKMPREQIEDDQVGMYMDIVPSMVSGWFKKQQALIFNVLTSNPLAYDGVALFSTSRTYGTGNTISNTTTSALTATTFEAAYVAMQSYTDHQGEPLATQPDTLVVGPSLAKTASDIIGNLYRGDGETSAVQIQNYYNSLGIRLVVSPYLIGTYANYWYLADTTDVVKGVLLQIRRNPMPVLSNAQEVSRTNTVDFMADGRMAAGPAVPHKIYGGLVSA
jgi:phage major head subunit gpT-like protein